jgi:Phage integrase central domain
VFKDAAKSYIESNRAGWRNAKHAAQWEATITTYAEPVIGALAIQEKRRALMEAWAKECAKKRKDRKPED